MKELSIEEKAKRYDEAIERAKSELNSPDKRLIEYIFPELKESEDEKIKKLLIGGLELHGNEIFAQGELDMILAWLEKQGENGTNGNEREIPFSEQKLAWSEEDNINCNRLLYFLNGGNLMQDHKIELFIWMESLKDRVLPKPVEWSDEDKGNLLDVKCIIDEVWHNQNVREEIDHSSEELESLWHWLDNIWQRVEYPQNTWKPSDEQIITLEYYMHTLVCNEHKEILFGLYADLKKLREE